MGVAKVIEAAFAGGVWLGEDPWGIQGTAWWFQIRNPVWKIRTTHFWTFAYFSQGVGEKPHQLEEYPHHIWRNGRPKCKG